jgi:subtilisin family serine protease
MNNPIVGLILVFSLLCGGTVLARGHPDNLPIQPLLTIPDQTKVTTPRLLLQLDDSITEAALDELRQHGTVHGWVERYRMVAVTPRGVNGRAAIESLPFIASVETDHQIYLAEVGTWDRDILDVVDMLPGFPFGPDDREVEQTGAGIHVAVIDSGLVKRWRETLDEGRVRADLARAFMGGGMLADDFVPTNEFNAANPTNLWERDTNGHGTAVTSHVIGFNVVGLVIPGLGPIAGVAPDAMIIPLKVVPNGQAFTHSSRVIAAITYVTELREDGVIGPTVINMSLGGPSPAALLRAAINDAINTGIIVVAAAGNEGEAGMGWPGAYQEVISVGATAWVNEFAPQFGMFWQVLDDVGNDPDGTGIPEQDQSAVTLFSSRARPDLNDPFPDVPDQELDVMAPGQFTIGPCLLPGIGRGNLTTCILLGTSFASPLTAGVAALLLEKDGTLEQAAVEAILKSTAGPMPGSGNYFSPIFGLVSWDTDCNGVPCDPVGSGLVQADAALDSIP